MRCSRCNGGRIKVANADCCAARGEKVRCSETDSRCTACDCDDFVLKWKGHDAVYISSFKLSSYSPSSRGLSIQGFLFSECKRYERISV